MLMRALPVSLVCCFTGHLLHATDTHPFYPSLPNPNPSSQAEDDAKTLKFNSPLAQAVHAFVASDSQRRRAAAAAAERFGAGRVAFVYQLEAEEGAPAGALADIPTTVIRAKARGYAFGYAFGTAGRIAVSCCASCSSHTFRIVLRCLPPVAMCSHAKCTKAHSRVLIAHYPPFNPPPTHADLSARCSSVSVSAYPCVSADGHRGPLRLRPRVN